MKFKNLFRTRYRIVTDTYLGYEVQYRVWFWPWYIQCSKNGHGINTFPSLEKAKVFMDQIKPTIVYQDD